jgi:ferric-dicitrate binding protein FerR (iron transport regulator)
VSPETCTRVRDAAAFRDGRMWRDAALLEHAEHCGACRKELQTRRRAREFKDAFPVLASIAAEGARPPSPSRSDSSAARTEAVRRRRRVALKLVAALSIVGFFIGRHLSPSSSRAPSSATPAPVFRISNLDNALFESKTEGGVVRSSMTRGVAAFRVEPLGPGQSFFLALPDGEIEVRGTLFVVWIEGGITNKIEVNEGAIALRLQGRPEMLLKAGQRWPDPPAGRPTGSFFQVAPASPPVPTSQKRAKPSE